MVLRGKVPTVLTLPSQQLDSMGNPGCKDAPVDGSTRVGSKYQKRVLLSGAGTGEAVRVQAVYGVYGREIWVHLFQCPAQAGTLSCCSVPCPHGF